MKKWILLNKLYILGAFAGALAGLMYWKFIGCLTGSCAITSDPYRSSLYFAFMGALVAGFFKKENKNRNVPGTDHEK
jgi:hypothetical protein